jgi:hypothetical protein
MGCTRFVHSGCTRLAFQRGKGYDHTLIVDLRAPDLWEQAGTKSIAASEDSRAQLRYGLIIRWSKVQILAGPPMFSISCGDSLSPWFLSGCV